MARTVDEKVAYSNKLNTPEVTSYVVGVKLYKSYVKSSESSRQATKKIIDNTMKIIKSGKGIQNNKHIVVLPFSHSHRAAGFC